VTNDWRDVLHDDKLRAHRAWVVGGCRGEGRFVARRAQLVDAKTYGLMLSRAIFDECDLTGALIEYSNLEFVEITDCIANAGSFYNSRLMNASLQRTRFERTNLRACWFTDAKVVDCTFDSADLDMSNFVGASVVTSSFRDARLADTQIDRASFEHCDLRGAKLSDQVYGSQFVDCDFRRANLDRLKIKDTRFIRCKLAGVSGRPIIEGPFEIVDGDFASDEPFEGPRSTDELRKLWEVRSV
jgi:uncharacterized protein YjbI with pentapeptide repeats